MTSTIRPLMLLLCTSVCCSCTTSLVARKVPLECRLQGADMCIKGFRYYLPRPYLVVNAPIDVETSKHEGVVLKRKAGVVSAGPDFVIELLGPTAAVPEFVNLRGEVLGAVENVGANYEPVEINLPVVLQTNAAAPAEAPAAGPGSQGDAPPGTQTPLGNAKPKKGNGSTSDESPQPAPVASDPDNLELVYLPDFEEQMAVAHTNFLSVSRIGLRFKDGWQLAGVAAKTDSTAVPVAVLSAIQSMLASSGGGGSGSGGKGGGAGSQEPMTLTGTRSSQNARVILTRRFYLQPGVYRLNRASEMDINVETCAQGLLTKLGIPISLETQVQLAAVAAADNQLQKQIADLKKQLEECKNASASKPSPANGQQVPVAKPAAQNPQNGSDIPPPPQRLK